MVKTDASADWGDGRCKGGVASLQDAASVRPGCGLHGVRRQQVLPAGLLALLLG